MNVIIANKYKEMLMSLDIEVIKSEEGVYDVSEIVNDFSNFFFDRMIIDITAIKDYTNTDNLQKLSINFDASRIVLVLDEETSNANYISKLISIGLYNFTRNSEGIKYLLAHPNTYRDVAHMHNVQAESSNNQVISNNSESISSESQKVIGIKALTSSAGATTLTYMMKKQLSTSYNVCALEVDKNDFIYFDDKDMIKVESNALAKELMKRREYDCILIDLNNYEDVEICTDIIYLVEPSTLKLNKLLMSNRKAFEVHQHEKIVLNKSNVKTSEISDFEYETKSKVFYNLPSLDERKHYNKEINGLLIQLGFSKIKPDEEDGGKGKILGMFKF